MSTDRDVILAALADGPLTSAEVVEATGFEQKLVANRLYAMKAAGLLTLSDGRYTVTGAPPAKAARTVAAREAEADEPKPKKRGRKPKTAKASPPPRGDFRQRSDARVRDRRVRRDPVQGRVGPARRRARGDRLRRCPGAVPADGRG